MQGPPALSPYVDQPAHLGATNSPQTPQLAPLRSASVMSQEQVDPEEAMEADAQARSGSEKQ